MTFNNELLAVLVSLKNNDFDQTKCKKEVDALHNAMQHSHEKSLEGKEQRRSGKIQPGTKLTATPLNKYLQRFPEPKPTKK